MKDREVTYEEVDLPFGNIDSDHAEGQTLYEAVGSALEELPKYSTSDRENGLRAYRNSGRLSFLNPSRPYMEVDIEGSREYSHLRVELNAPSDHSLDNLQDDLEEFEESLSEQSLEQASEGGHTSTKSPRKV